MRLAHRILSTLPLLVALLLWARSTQICDVIGNGRIAILSESAGLYLLVGDTDVGYATVPAAWDGILEEERGGVRGQGLPVWAWEDRGDRLIVLQWWAIAVACTGPAAWA